MQKAHEVAVAEIRAHHNKMSRMTSQLTVQTLQADHDADMAQLERDHLSMSPRHSRMTAELRGKALQAEHEAEAHPSGRLTPPSFWKRDCGHRLPR